MARGTPARMQVVGGGITLTAPPRWRDDGPHSFDPMPTEQR